MVGGVDSIIDLRIFRALSQQITRTPVTPSNLAFL
jgi:hypothetical protein